MEHETIPLVPFPVPGLPLLKKLKVDCRVYILSHHFLFECAVPATWVFTLLTLRTPIHQLRKPRHLDAQCRRSQISFCTPVVNSISLTTLLLPSIKIANIDLASLKSINNLRELKYWGCFVFFFFPPYIQGQPMYLKDSSCSINICWTYECHIYQFGPSINAEFLFSTFKPN